MNALITDEMVEAGVEEIRKAKHTCFDRWTDHDAIRAVLEAGAEPALAAKDADIARLREALESLISAAEEFHEAATAHLSDTTFDRDGILAAREAELTVAALPDARAALAGGSDASTAPSSTTGEAA